MPASPPGPLLSRLRFTDPQGDADWRHVVVPASRARALPSAPGPSLAPATALEIAGAGTTWTLDAWLEETWTTSLLVLDGGAVAHEWYAPGLGPRTCFLGASMTKSVLAHLVGRAVTAGELRVEDEVRALVPELAGSGYDGTRVLDVLTMTTGVDWVEDHRDPDSLASTLLTCFAEGGDSRALLGRVRPGVVPGTRWSYCTADSQVLDWARERATGRTFVEDLTSLWADLGCEDDAVVGVDGHGVALAGGALAATARDWARIGRLAATGRPAGADDQALHDPAWTADAARPAYAFTAPGRLPSSICGHVGFGRHWWPLDDDGRRVAADGSRGQLVAVDRGTGAVVVKTSQWPYGDPWADRHFRDLSYLGLQQLLDALDPHDDPVEGVTRP
ncbi:serine hydrolase [Nocardioides sp. HDW12B]|uniref:serine hydrolase domain-containing protein n=1 Tax=Nocardioides sp. HDW12B TaxID=2714939 RepID=UPI001408AC84|nr:serine hydrolase [Nocardioides sp. HDW12B]QIK65982.1 serine hydrolase [Nocardioides sp. HDW12B]